MTQTANIRTSNDSPITLQPLSSFSSSFSTARDFAGKNVSEKTQVLIAIDVPASDIFSMPGIGFGCLDEEEFVVKGGDYQAKVFSHPDLWYAVEGKEEFWSKGV